MKKLPTTTQDYHGEISEKPKHVWEYEISGNARNLGLPETLVNTLYFGLPASR